MNTEKQTAENTCGKTAKALQLSGGICLIAGAFLTIVFAFFIGVSATVSMNLSSYIDISMESTETNTVWDVFGPAYKHLAELFNNTTEYTKELKASYYMPTILSTVVGAGTLVSVLTLTVIAALKYCRHFKDASVNYEKYAVASICTYIAGALAFFAINGVSMNALSGSSSHYDNISVTIAPSAITKTGMILVGILIGAYFVLKAAGQGKALAEKGVAANLVFTICSLVFSAVALCFLIKVTTAVSAVQNINAELNFQALAVMLATINNQQATKVPAMEAEGYISSYALAITEQFVQIGLFAMIALVLVRKLSGFPKQKKTDIVEPIVFFFLALVYLILACVCISEANYYINGLNKDAEIYRDFVILASAPVAVLACATLNLIVGVGSRIPLFRRKKEQNNAQAQTPAEAEEPVTASESIAEPAEE